MKTYRDEVRKDVVKVGVKGRSAYRAVVANWSSKNRPKFFYRTQVSEEGVLLRILVKEKNEDKPLWMWIDKTGTEPHTITPKKPDGLLFFVWDGVAGSYQPKTQASPARFGGPGRAIGSLTAAREVHHPGFPPRRFSYVINNELRIQFKKGVYNGGRRGLRKAKKAS